MFRQYPVGPYPSSICPSLGAMEWKDEGSAGNLARPDPTAYWRLLCDDIGHGDWIADHVEQA